MAHYAFLDANGIVTQVIVGRDEHDLVPGVESWAAYYGIQMGATCRQTSYNTRGGIHYDPATGEPSADQSKALRKNYAGIGYAYDSQRDAFIPPKPDTGDWVLDEQTCLWVEAPLDI